MVEIKAPNNYKQTHMKYSIFLGGTIDMGNSFNWQKQFKEHLEKQSQFEDYWMILNPRRDDWDSSWIQHIDNPQFNEQVTWESEALEDADLRVFVFLPDSKSPITLMELGASKDKPNVVYCPFEYYRSGNVYIFCKRHNIPMYTDWENFLQSFKIKQK